MILFVNERNEVMDVNKTDKTYLTPIRINDATNPFKEWTEAKICCYCVTADEKGNVTGFWPFVSTLIIDQLDRLGKNSDVISDQVTDTQMAICDNYEAFTDYTIVTDESIEVGNTQITDLEMAVCDIYEMIAEMM